MKDVADESVHGLWSSHNLEHLYAHQVTKALKEFYRVLKTKGVAVIALPDIQRIAVEVAKDNLEEELFQSSGGPISPIDIIWGHRRSITQGNHYMAHKTGFTPKTLKHKLSHRSKTQYNRRTSSNKICFSQ